MTKILAIDDKNDNLISLKAVIKDALPEAMVYSALNGNTGIELANETDPDVILLDIVMPGMDGFEVCRLLKQNDKARDIPVVFLTSLKGDKANRIKALEVGGEGFLAKPIEVTELMAQINAMVKIKYANRQKREEKERLAQLVAERTLELQQSQLATFELMDNLKLENQVRKETEQFLYRSEESYRNLFEANPHPLLIYNLETLCYLAVNEKAIHHYGYSRDEFLNKTIYDIKPVEDVERLLEAVKNEGFSGLQETGLWRLRKKNNQIIWVEITTHPTIWQGQDAMVILVNDITERKLAEEELKTALLQLEFHENNSPLAVIEFNNKFEITKWSNNAKNLFGWSAEEVLGKSIGEFKWVHEEDEERVASLSAAMLASTKTSSIHTNRNYQKNGSIITCEWYNSAMMDSDGKLISVHSLVLDITERKRSEESLKESNEFNKTLLQTIPFGMDIISEDGDILFINEILEKKLGTEILGKKCWAIYRDNKSRCVSCPLLSEIIIGQTTVMESGDILGGKTFQISHTGMLFKGRKAMLEIFQDITERKQIEAELINAKEKAEESDHLKTSFLANMSHEIRTPLNSIIGFSELLTDPDYDPSQQFNIARMIYFSGNNLLTIINNILEISKIEAGQVSIAKKLFSANKLLFDIEKEFLFKSIEKGIDFIVDKSNEEKEVFINSDETKVRQILSNFISNAMKFTRQGAINLAFRLYDNTIEFSVKDTGIGISAEFHDKIFEHFRQVESANTRTHGGNGLGLAISKGLVKLLGGNIWMESEKGKGSTFYFSIPIH